MNSRLIPTDQFKPYSASVRKPASATSKAHPTPSQRQRALVSPASASSDRPASTKHAAVVKFITVEPCKPRLNRHTLHEKPRAIQQRQRMILVRFELE